MNDIKRVKNSFQKWAVFIEKGTGLITLLFLEDLDFSQLHLVSKDNFSLIIISLAFISFALMKFRVSFSSSEDTCLCSGSTGEEKLQENSKRAWQRNLEA